MTLGNTKSCAATAMGGRGTAHALVDIVVGEGGMITMVNSVTMVFCAMLIVLLLNVGHITHHKVEMQNAADSIVNSGATWQARGLNSTTATNHIIGEMMAFVAIHEALGGTGLDPETPLSTHGAAAEEAREDSVNARLTAAWQLANRAATPAYETVKQDIKARRTIYDAKMRLKRWLTYIYYMKAAALAMQDTGIAPIVAAGQALWAAMQALELVVELEYQILNALRAVAESLFGLKALLRDTMLPMAKEYTDYIVEETPNIALQAAVEIGAANGVLGTLYPNPAALPVAPDPLAFADGPWIGDDQRVPAEMPPPRCPPHLDGENPNPRRQVVKTCQLTRATWPWVNYHRDPIKQFMGRFLKLSNAKKFYHDHTADATIQLCDELQRKDGYDLWLYVLAGYPAPDKGYALWTDDPELADDHFSVVGLAYRDKPNVVGSPAVLHHTHQEGRVALAQAIVYNANRQQPHPHHIDLGCKRVQPIYQADVGWDTLNWEEGDRPYELVGIGISPRFPRIRINWQAKLVPLTTNRLNDIKSVGAVPPPFSDVLSRLLDDVPQSLRTH